MNSAGFIEVIFVHYCTTVNMKPYRSVRNWHVLWCAHRPRNQAQTCLFAIYFLLNFKILIDDPRFPDLKDHKFEFCRARQLLLTGQALTARIANASEHGANRAGLRPGRFDSNRRVAWAHWLRSLTRHPPRILLDNGGGLFLVCSVPSHIGQSRGRSRVADLAASRVALVVVCKRCRHEAVLFPHRLVELGADRLAVADLPRRLRCRE